MGYYSEYLDKGMGINYQAMQAERKRLLTQISSLRGNRDILVYASDLNKGNTPISIDYTDILPFQDQLTYLKGTSIDIILETPGGYAEVVEDLVKLVRNKYKDGDVGIIIPGYAKSAGTIFAMSGNEILMGESSGLGPIDAQILTNNKRYSAEAFLEGLKKIKDEADQSNKLNLAYIPILQNISPGEIQHCENAQNFSKALVTDWLARYKFRNWDRHSSNGEPVTNQDKMKRASEIAGQLCKHSDWLTHGRSIKIEDFERMRLKIEDFGKNPQLNEAILRYYAVLRMTFEGATGIYKIFETVTSQILRAMPPPIQALPSMVPQQQKINSAKFGIQCNGCKTQYNIQANLESNIPYEQGTIPYPVENNIFVCPNCGTQANLLQARIQIESQLGRKVVN